MAELRTGIGVIGAGYWANNMLRAIQESTRCDLLAICDLSQNALDSAGLKYPTVHTTTNIDSVLSNSEVDAIYIATPPSTHSSIAMRALSAGKHVLVEKPMTTESQSVLDLIELSVLNQRILMVGHTFLYSPPVLKVKELIERGTVGDIFYVESQRVNLGKYQDSGVLWDLAPHDLSIILYWLGETPLGVSATGRSFRSSSREDVVFMNLDFPSGAIAQVHVSWLAPAKLRRTTVSGSQRMVVYDDTAGPEAVKVFNHGVDRSDRSDPKTFGEYQLAYRQGDIWIPRLESAEPLRSEWDHFLTCIETGENPRSAAEQGLWVIKIMEAAERSLRSNRREAIRWKTPSKYAITTASCGAE